MRRDGSCFYRKQTLSSVRWKFEFTQIDTRIGSAKRSAQNRTIMNFPANRLSFDRAEILRSDRRKLKEKKKIRAWSRVRESPLDETVAAEYREIKKPRDILIYQFTGRRGNVTRAHVPRVTCDAFPPTDRSNDFTQFRATRERTRRTHSERSKRRARGAN